ncbi:hypothetical protein LY78DRAFT_714448 [Colletotrichum sublineola]|uniref:Uncharacterized protein n=1 Tax=Colletotrichum sublineola TaxID=1173701 RepID=A0A066XZT6_COLSU|nr:hypothetical protein LY78DRAFT_714448 [Colletotrichum sublineola]KDN71500.1 hypothetical protein CSUB01_07593 [Colletotrichum sublineola]
MDYHSAVLAHPEFLALMQDASRLPRDLDTLKTWYFTRLASDADRHALLGVYNSLVFDLGLDHAKIHQWLTNLGLHAGVERAFAADPARVPEARRAWFAERGRAVFRCDRFGHDTPVFRFEALENRKRWPAEWKGMRKEDIELAIDATEGGMATGFREEADWELWLVEMARRWKNGQFYVHS